MKLFSKKNKVKNDNTSYSKDDILNSFARNTGSGVALDGFTGSKAVAYGTISLSKEDGSIYLYRYGHKLAELENEYPAKAKRRFCIINEDYNAAVSELTPYSCQVLSISDRATLLDFVVDSFIEEHLIFDKSDGSGYLMNCDKQIAKVVYKKPHLIHVRDMIDSKLFFEFIGIIKSCVNYTPIKSTSISLSASTAKVICTSICTNSTLYNELGTPVGHCIYCKNNNKCYYAGECNKKAEKAEE